MRPQPLIAVAEVEASSRWYQRLLGAASGHGGADYERLVVDGELVLQLHALGLDHHHAAIGDPSRPVGNGVALWFEVDDLDAVAVRAGELRAKIVADIHVNPNAGHRELWIRDPDGYLVVFAGAAGD